MSSEIKILSYDFKKDFQPSVNEAKVDAEPIFDLNSSENKSYSQEEEISTGNFSISSETYETIKLELRNEIDARRQALEDEQNSRGLVTGAINMVQGLFGGGDKKELAEIEKLEKAYASLETNPALLSNVYKTVFNKELDIESLSAIQEADEFVSSLSYEEKEIIADILTEQIECLDDAFQEAQSQNGWLSSTWNAFKNFTGIGASSKKTEASINSTKEILSKLKENPDNLAEIYKSLTGKDLTPEEYIKNLINGESSLMTDTKAAQATSAYISGQSMATDTIADIASGIMAVGAVALSPFTGGLSLGALAVAGCSGVVVKAGLKASDCIGNEKTYTLKDLGYDAVTGFLNGAMAPLSNAAGGTAGKCIMKALGQEALEETVKGGGIAALKQSAIKLAAKAGQYAVDGALSGATDSASRAMGEGRFEDIIKDGFKGGLTGLLLAPVVGLGFDGASLAANKLKGILADEVLDKAGQEIQEQVTRELGDGAQEQLTRETSQEAAQDAVIKEMADATDDIVSETSNLRNQLQNAQTVDDFSRIGKEEYQRIRHLGEYQINYETNYRGDMQELSSLITDGNTGVEIHRYGGAQGNAWSARSAYGIIDSDDIVDRMSLNVVADPSLIKEMDEFMRTGKYYNSQGQLVQVSNLTDFYYKTPTNLKNWAVREDPITIYFGGKVSKETQDALTQITQKYARGSIEGAVKEASWLLKEMSPSAQMVASLQQEASSININLARAIKKSAGSSNILSSGQYRAYKKIIEVYKTLANFA